jgi:ABC-type amino acid transport substrate-binding protein
LKVGGTPNPKPCYCAMRSAPGPCFLAVAVAAAALSSCGMPRDPDGATDRIEGGILRVGVSENPPWVILRGAQPEGLEPALVRDFARAQHAAIQWTSGGETPLLEALERRKLDLVVAGVDSKSPWSGKLGASRPYAEAGGRKHIWLAAPGENQLLLRVDRFLAGRKASLPQASREQPSR